MLEVKFRAWNKLDKKMIYNPEIMHGNNWGTIGYMGYIITDKNGPYFERLMQYTGLKDKNNKEIYEGDILKFIKCCEAPEHIGCDHSDTTWQKLSEVVYKENSFQLKYSTGTKRYDPKIIYYGFIDRWARNLDLCEVIGNIYENPELLTKGK